MYRNRGCLSLGGPGHRRSGSGQPEGLRSRRGVTREVLAGGD